MKNPSLPSAPFFDSILNKKEFVWGVLFFLVLISHVHGLFENNLDDFSVLRASSYMSRSPHNQLLSRLRQHLGSKCGDLGAYLCRRYQLRFDGSTNYFAPNWLVARFETLPLYSAYQSVFLANLCLHLLAVTSLFLALRTLLGPTSQLHQLSILLSLSPAVFFTLSSFLYYIHLGWMFFPFHNYAMLWITDVPRGSALTFFFASLVFWLNVGDPSISKARHLAIAILLSAASVLCHRSMGILLIGTTLFFAVLYNVLKVDPREMALRVGLRRFLLVFNGLLALTAVVKLAVLVAVGSPELHILAPAGTQTSRQLLRNMVILVSWTLATNALVYSWLRLRQRQTDGDSAVLQTGDRFFKYLLPFSILGIGLNVFHPGRVLWYGSLFIPTEACVRIVGLTHLLWWMTFGIWLFTRITDDHKKSLARAIAGLLILLCVTAGYELFRASNRASAARLLNKKELTVQSDTLLALPGTEAYSDEPLYFQAIANELRDTNCHHR